MRGDLTINFSSRVSLCERVGLMLAVLKWCFLLKRGFGFTVANTEVEIQEPSPDIPNEDEPPQNDLQQ